MINTYCIKKCGECFVIRGLHSVTSKTRSRIIYSCGGVANGIGNNASSGIGDSVGDGVGDGNKNGGLVGVRWSPNHNYQFATASSSSDCISLWNIAHGTAAVARQRGKSIGSVRDLTSGGMTPIRRRFASSSVVTFVFQRTEDTNSSGANDKTTSAIERILVATKGGHLEDMAMYDIDLTYEGIINIK